MQMNAQLPAGIPRPLVQANQAFLVTTLLLAALLRQPWLVAGVLLVQLPGLLFGGRYNPVMRLSRPLIASRLPGALLEDAQQQRFNNAIAVALLVGSLLAQAAGHPWLGWGLALAVVAAASVALAGFCVGCFIHYQLVQLRRRWRARG